MRHHRDDEHRKRQRGDCRDDEHQLQGLADAKYVDTDKDDVEGQIDRPASDAEQRLAVGADKDGDGSWRDGVLDKDRSAGEKTAQRAERATSKAITAACGGDHRGQLGEREAHAQVHGRHQQRGDEQTAPAPLGEAEVPAGVVARDDVGDAEANQQHPTSGAFLQFAFLKIGTANCFEIGGVGRGCRTAVFESHGGSSFDGVGYGRIVKASAVPLRDLRRLGAS